MTETGAPDRVLSPLKQAFLALEQAQTRVEELERERSEPIAIVGAGCRVPTAEHGAEDGLDAYWKLISEKKSSVADRAEERFAGLLEEARLPQAARWAALLKRIDGFDPQHFGISPREAAGIDPQQRLLLEVVWEALENAGIDPFSTYQSSTGVYIGICSHDYAQIQLSDAGIDAVNPHFASGIASSVASGRISYVFGLRGPSVSIDTACSSSLVAVHLACEAIRRGECSMALAGGVNLILSPEYSVAFADAGMLSPRGICRAFDAGADGFVRGEGCGIVVLKRLREAEANGDRVLGLILGSAINQDGPTSGLTVPNGQAQQELLRQAHHNAQVEPWQVGYVEAHGTGTSLGDPIEAEALGVVFAAGRKRERPLLLGSVKTNFGHLEAAAGIAGLIKVVLGLQHRVIPAQLHLERTSEHVRWSELPLEVVTEARPWEEISGRRIAGVSSFGFSGTNAHVVVEAPAEIEATEEQSRPMELLVITARTAPALRELAKRYAEFLEQSSARWGDICHTAATGRGLFGERLALAADSNAQAAKRLRLWLSDEAAAPEAATPEAAAPGVSRGRVRAGERVRLGLVLGNNLAALDSLLALDTVAERSEAWQSKWRSWGVEPVMVAAAGTGAEIKLASAGVSLALVLGRAELSLPSVRVTGAGGWPELVVAIAELFVRGVRIDWSGWEAGLKRRPVNLPSYAFQRERFWIESQGKKRKFAGEETGRRMLGRRLRAAGVQAQFEAELAIDGQTSWIAEHVIDGRPILPLTGHVELMLEAGAEVFGSELIALEDAVLHAPLTIEQKRAIQTVVAEASAERSRIRIYAENSRPEISGDAWQVVSEGWVRMAAEPKPERLDLEAIRAQLSEQKDVAGFYADMAARRVEFGPLFRGITALWSGADEALGEVRGFEDEQDYGFAPWRLDACLQMFGAALGDPGLYMPSSVGEIRIYGAPVECCWSYMRRRRIDSSTLAADFTITRPDGVPLAQFQNVLFRKFKAEKPEIASWIYQLAWRPEEPASPSKREPETKRVLLVGNSRQMQPTAAHLRRGGTDVVSIEPGESPHPIAEILASSPGFDAVLYFAASMETEQELNAGEVTGQAERPLRSLLAVVHAAVGDAVVKTPRLYVITQNACAAREDEARIRLLEAPLVGLVNSVAVEAPELRCTLIDADVAGDEVLAGQIAGEVLAGSNELRIAIRSGRRHVARLERVPAVELADSDREPMRLSMGSGIDALTYIPLERRELEPNEVEIAVRATALNFRDVLKATGVLEHAGPIGTDCAGVVVRTGSAVRGFKAGEAVVAIAPGCFATHVVTASELAVRKPEELSFEEAAAQTVAYLTADYCLNELGRMRKGQRVLIHAAAGGVGLAAVNLCKRAGVEILATAGSEQKRAYLRSLGIKQVFDSRTPAFKDEIVRGVDIVLNSLTGPAIDAGISVLKATGRFIELGKTDIREADAIERQSPGVKYLLADLTPFFAERSPWIGSHLQSLLRDIATGDLAALPVTAFASHEVKHAFRHMAAARHIGRVVVREGTRDLARGTHLITGGLRGIGLELAQWLVRQGARNLVLIGRRQPGDAALQAIRQMEARSATVRILNGDIADFATAEFAVSEAGRNLRGVWHCAGTIDDAALGAQSWERMAHVMRPKADGAWNLHLLTRGRELEVFVLFSSLASLTGSRGQANYCAANAFLDGLACFRRANGLPALSVNWGAWGEKGLAAGQAMRRQLARAGLKPMQPEDALAALKLALHTGRPHLTVAAIDWPKYLSQLPDYQDPDSTNSSVYSELMLEEAPGKTSTKISGRVAAPNRLQQSMAKRQTCSRQRIVRPQCVASSGAQHSAYASA